MRAEGLTEGPPVVLWRRDASARGVPLLVHQQVRVVDLLELELDRLDEAARHHVGRLLPHRHRLLQVGGPKLDHHRVGVAVHHHRVVLLPVRRRVVRLDLQW